MRFGEVEKVLRRIYAENRADGEAGALWKELGAVLGIGSVEKLRILFRYDVESDRPLPLRELFAGSGVEAGRNADLLGARVFATEPAPGEEDAAAEAFKERLFALSSERAAVRSAKIYAVYGKVSEEELSAIKEYVLRPKKEREASLALPHGAQEESDVPEEFETVSGFRYLDMGGLDALAKKYDLDMGASELAFLQEYFRSEFRDPTEMELYVLSALYMTGEPSLSARIESAELGGVAGRAYRELLSVRRELGQEGAATLREIAAIPRELQKKRDASLRGEGDALSIKMKQSGAELLFCDEATRPMRAFAALRLGCTSDPLALSPAERRRKNLEEAECAEALLAEGIAAGQVDEVYHEGYRGRPLPLGVYLSYPADPFAGPVLEKPVPGDKAILIGAKGGGLFRLTQNAEAAGMIKKYRRSGAGGVVLAAASLADGLDLDLDKIPAKHGEGVRESALLGGTGAAIAVVGAREAERFLQIAEEEGVEAEAVATVAEVPRLILRYGRKVVANLSHAFLTDGFKERRVRLSLEEEALGRKAIPTDFSAGMRVLAGDLNICSRKALAEKFDHTAGGATVYAPFGGRLALTPAEAAVHRILPEGCVSYMAWGGDPYLAEKSAFHGGYLAVVESVSKLIAAGADLADVYLFLAGEFALEEGGAPREKEASAILGACKAQLDLGICSVGERMPLSEGNVPPALFSFAMTTGVEREAVAPAFKAAGHKVVLLAPAYDEDGLPVPHSLIKNYKIVTALMREGKALAAYTVSRGGVAEGILKCCLGNEIGFRFADMVSMETVFGSMYGAFILELGEDIAVGEELGRTTLSETIARGLDLVPLVVLKESFEGKLSPLFRGPSAPLSEQTEKIASSRQMDEVSLSQTEKLRAVLPVFERTFGVRETERAFMEAGVETNLVELDLCSEEGLSSSLARLADSLQEAQIFFLMDGFEGDHVCGLASLIALCLRKEGVRRAIEALCERGGLIGGVGVGFDVLLRLGLLPYGKFTEQENPSLFLTKAPPERVRAWPMETCVSSAASPWQKGAEAGDIFSAPARIYGGLACSDETIKELAERGQIASQFVDPEGNASADSRYNPGGSAYAVEGLLSPDGKIMGTFTNFLLRKKLSR